MLAPSFPLIFFKIKPLSFSITEYILNTTQEVGRWQAESAGRHRVKDARQFGTFRVSALAAVGRPKSVSGHVVEAKTPAPPPLMASSAPPPLYPLLSPTFPSPPA